jgi:hypothetical protein
MTIPLGATPSNSVCSIPGGENGNAGTFLGTFFLNNRMLDGDKFYVSTTK